MDAVAQTWGTATAEGMTRDPGHPGVRIRLYADLRQVLPQAAGGESCPGCSEAGSVTTGESDGTSLSPRSHTRPRLARSYRSWRNRRQPYAARSSRSWGPLLRTLLTAVDTGRA
ncbi:DUF6207 family protein [Streptomyces canus]|uniref:DUF6207 family protein n=1 Tax=Streptomyces canus TaxID=58343 RepID=UPI0027D8E904|nr:DUF6207 family protein [Streptomyces canus]